MTTAQKNAPVSDSSVSVDPLVRTAQEHLASLLFALADLKAQAMEGNAVTSARRISALIDAVAIAEKACLSPASPIGASFRDGRFIPHPKKLH